MEPKKIHLTMVLTFFLLIANLMTTAAELGCFEKPSCTSCEKETVANGNNGLKFKCPSSENQLFTVNFSKVKSYCPVVIVMNITCAPGANWSYFHDIQQNVVSQIFRNNRASVAIPIMLRVKISNCPILTSEVLESIVGHEELLLLELDNALLNFSNPINIVGRLIVRNTTFDDSMTRSTSIIRSASLELVNNSLTALDLDKILKSSFYFSDLNLSDNNMESIPNGTFKNLNVFEDLSFSRNKLSFLPENCCSHVQNLDLSYNNFTVIDRDMLKSIQGLHSLNLEGNPVERFGRTTFSHMKYLKKLNLKGISLNVEELENLYTALENTKRLREFRWCSDESSYFDRSRIPGYVRVVEC